MSRSGWHKWQGKTVRLARRSSQNVRPQVEALEQRLVPTISATGQVISLVEGVSKTVQVASFIDTTPSAANNYAVSIDWGDGTTSAGTVSLDAGSGIYLVTGPRAYAEDTPSGSPYTVKETITESGDDLDTATVNSAALVAEADVSVAQSATLSGQEGSPVSGIVATFTDRGSPEQSSAYSAVIDWGDGVTGHGVISGANGTFSITGSHTYTDEGTFTIAISVSETGVDPSPAGTASLNASIGGDDDLSPAALTITPTEETAFSGTVATFTDTYTGNVAADFTATIDWGDGTSSAGVVSGGGAHFSVSGTHTYAEDGSFGVTVTLADDAPGMANSSVTSRVNVAEDAFVGNAMQVKGFEQTPLNVTVAVFTHANGLEPVAGFTATIDWGDGTTSAGTVTQATPGGVYSVQGTHTYSEESSTSAGRVFTFTVTVVDGASTGTAHGSANILEELLPDGSRGTPNQRWLFEVYRDVLNRQIDAGGLAAWNNQLNQGMSRVQIVQTIETSKEYRTDQVQALYTQYLRRSADAAGLANGVAFLQAGGTVEQLATATVASVEYFQNRGGGTNSGFLAVLYQDALGRPIDAGGAASFGAALAAGVSRAEVAASILSSAEYHRHLVTTYYTTLLDRAADPGSEGWVGVLNQGARDEFVIANFAASPEFYNKTAS